MNKPVAEPLDGTVSGRLARAPAASGLGARREKWRRHALVVADERGRVIEWNEAATLVFGYEREEVLGRHLSKLILPPPRREEGIRRFQVLFNENGPERPASAPIEAVAMRSSGEEIPIWARVTRTATAPPNYVFSICDLSGTEPTELNHRQLEAIVACSEDAIGTVALDGTVMTWNAAAEEIYGFSAAEAIGDKVANLTVPRELRGELQHWEQRLARGETIETETRRLRRDGSEVVVFLRGLPVRGDGDKVIAAVWIARDITDRRRREERERKEAKSLRWVRKIGAALAGDDLLLAAQPVVDLRSGKVDHHELLLRMDLGTRLAKPDEFIGEAERSGQIREIDLWAMRRGIELAATAPVAINVSAKSLGSELLLTEIDRGLKRSSVSPERVTIEITETAGAVDLEQAAAWVARLTERGCRVSLDDFGTGYGAFTYLNRLAVGELKIAREFVARLRHSEADRRVVSTIVAVGRNFGMTMVAEGVEDVETLAIVEGFGVEFAQGHLFGRPEIIGADWGTAAA
jgi:PAS domain S-box-containing protein